MVKKAWKIQERRLTHKWERPIANIKSMNCSIETHTGPSLNFTGVLRCRMNFATKLDFEITLKVVSRCGTLKKCPHLSGSVIRCCWLSNIPLMSTYSVCYLQAVRQCSHAHTTSILQHYICSTMSIKNPLVPDLKKKKVSFFIAVKMVLLVIPSISIFSFQTTFVANKIAGVGYSPKNNCMQPHKKLSLKNIHIESFFFI